MPLAFLGVWCVLVAVRACRLWHQLTDKLLAFVSDEANHRGQNMLEVRYCWVKTPH